jgi:hypothetical protein
MKQVPLSDTSISGSPWVAKSIWSLSTVTWEVVEVTGQTPIHLKCASTNIKNTSLRMVQHNQHEPVSMVAPAIPKDAEVLVVGTFGLVDKMCMT